MKCTKCGSELKKTDKFCGECGKVQESDEVIYIDETKSSKGLIITIIILGVIILAGAGIGMWLLLTNTDSNSKESNKENNEEIVIIDDDDDKEIHYMKYKFTAPEGFKIYKNGKSNYLKNSEFMMVFVSYPLTYDQIIANKDLLLDELSKQGYGIDSFETKEIDNKKYIFVVGNFNNISCGFVFNELDSDTNMFITITSNYLGNFNNKWFDDAVKFLKSAIKEEQ